jgi:hypothetical protein
LELPRRESGISAFIGPEGKELEMSRAKKNTTKENILLRIIKMFSHGSVNLQFGRFLTREMIEKRKAALAHHRFRVSR